MFKKFKKYRKNLFQILIINLLLLFFNVIAFNETQFIGYSFLILIILMNILMFMSIFVNKIPFLLFISKSDIYTFLLTKTNGERREIYKGAQKWKSIILNTTYVSTIVSTIISTIIGSLKSMLTNFSGEKLNNYKILKNIHYLFNKIDDSAILNIDFVVVWFILILSFFYYRNRNIKSVFFDCFSLEDFSLKDKLIKQIKIEKNDKVFTLLNPYIFDKKLEFTKDTIIYKEVKNKKYLK